MDRSFVPPFLGVANGTHFKSALLTVRRNGKEQQEFFKMTPNEVQILSLESQVSGDAIEVDAAPSCNRIEMAYRPQNADGSLGYEIKGQWDLRAHQASFSGDPEVLIGLAQAGGKLNSTGPVPEPATWASLAAGLAVVAAVARRRRQTAATGESHDGQRAPGARWSSAGWHTRRRNPRPQLVVRPLNREGARGRRGRCGPCQRTFAPTPWRRPVARPQSHL